MENKIQELTDKIYREGVEKGNEEAQKLLSLIHICSYLCIRFLKRTAIVKRAIFEQLSLIHIYWSLVPRWRSGKRRFVHGWQGSFRQIFKVGTCLLYTSEGGDVLTF